MATSPRSSRRSKHASSASSRKTDPDPRSATRRPWRAAAHVLLTLATALLLPEAALAQNDTLRTAPAPVDTTVVIPADTTVAPSDTALVPADTVLVPADTALVPADTALVPTATVDLVSDTAAVARPRAPIIAPTPPPVRGRITGIPARTAVHSPADLVAHSPGVFVHSLGTAFAPVGATFGLMPPQTIGLTLDDRPADDIFTGRPALERLPEELIGPLVVGRSASGSPLGVAAHRRDLVAEVPITELRYRTGSLGHQIIGVTHAQTRRPGFVQRIGGDAARMSFHFHVGGHRSRVEFDNSEVDGWGIEGRVRFYLPALTLGITQRHHRRTEGAWGGVQPDTEAPFLSSAPVVDPIAEREIINNDLTLEAHAAILSPIPPTRLTAYWTAATLRHDSQQTIQSRADRFGVVISQPIVVAGHHLELRADGRAGRIMGGAGLPPGAMPLEVHLSVRDSVRLGVLGLRAGAGWHQSEHWSFPSAHIGVDASAGILQIEAEAFFGGVRRSPVEIYGFGDRIEAQALSGESVAGVSAGIGMEWGDVAFRLRAEAQSRTDPRLLLVDLDGNGRMMTAEGRLDQVLGRAEFGWRAEALRGLYLSAWAGARATLSDPPTPELLLESRAEPQTWGAARAGGRLVGLFDDALDLDVYVRARGWSAFRGRTLHRETAMFGLATGDRPEVPATVVLDGVLEAGLGGRATAFLTYENALAGVAYEGAYAVLLYPLPRPTVRAGLFWVIAD